MHGGLPGLEAEEGGEAQEEPAPAAQADAAEQQPEDRVRLAAVHGEEVGRRRADR